MYPYCWGGSSAWNATRRLAFQIRMLARVSRYLENSDFMPLIGCCRSCSQGGFFATMLSTHWGEHYGCSSKIHKGHSYCIVFQLANWICCTQRKCAQKGHCYFSFSLDCQWNISKSLRGLDQFFPCPARALLRISVLWKHYIVAFLAWHGTIVSKLWNVMRLVENIAYRKRK